MNRRKAKKRVKRKWHLDFWIKGIRPREMDEICSTAYKALMDAFCKALDHAILYGTAASVNPVGSVNALRDGRDH